MITNLFRCLIYLSFWSNCNLTSKPNQPKMKSMKILSTILMMAIVLIDSIQSASIANGSTQDFLNQQTVRFEINLILYVWLFFVHLFFFVHFISSSTNYIIEAEQQQQPSVAIMTGQPDGTTLLDGQITVNSGGGGGHQLCSSSMMNNNCSNSNT